MRRGALSVCVVLMLAFFAAPEAKPRSVTMSRAASTTRERALVAAVNSVRALHLLPKLSIDVCLTRAARFHSEDMLRRDYFAHGNLMARMYRFHVRGRLFEENLAWSSGVMSAKAALANWLASPPHRATMLDPSLRRIGVAAPVGAFGGLSTATLVTADFAAG
jgi:uncharacterized protein YkwD